MLKDSNIHPRCQPMFVLSALRGGSTDAILASYGQDRPPDSITMETLWTQLDCIFAPVELESNRDKRFAKIKLENFPLYCILYSSVSESGGRMRCAT